ncbi:hypothetical protein BGZ76_000691 [Entomortierella beljakovae]|nr:hypothetical protein BGZ76_000691 [Entomortierella beljakovae]
MSPTTRSSKRTTSDSPNTHSEQPTPKKSRPSKSELREKSVDTDIKLEPSHSNDTKNQTTYSEPSENEPSPHHAPKTESNRVNVKEEPDDAQGIIKPEEVDQSFVIVNHSNTIEKGHVFFFYRQKIDVDTPKGINDIQKLYLLLSPDAAVGRPAEENKVGQVDDTPKPSLEGKPCHRLLIIPKKTLPVYGQGAKSRAWAFVEEASSDLEKLESRLERYTYSTKTVGERTQESARLIGEARYEIFLDQQNHSHFIYELFVPQEPTLVQQEFNILQNGHFIVQVKNPEIQTPASTSTNTSKHDPASPKNTENNEQEHGKENDGGDKEKEEKKTRPYTTLGKDAAILPKHLQEKFRGKRKDWVRYTSLDSTEFLDTRHLEILLFAVNNDVKEEFAEVLQSLEDDIKEEEENSSLDENSEDNVYKELNLDEKVVQDATKEFV